MCNTVQISLAKYPPKYTVWISDLLWEGQAGSTVERGRCVSVCSRRGAGPLLLLAESLPQAWRLACPVQSLLTISVCFSQAWSSGNSI